MIIVETLFYKMQSNKKAPLIKDFCLEGDGFLVFEIQIFRDRHTEVKSNLITFGFLMFISGSHFNCFKY